MGSLQEITRSKVDADLNRRLQDLPVEVKTLQGQLAAKGLLKSGVMLKGVLELAQRSLEEQGSAVTTHYTWALREALTASEAWVRELAEDGANSLAPLFSRASDQIAEACRLSDQPALAARLLADLETTHLQVRSSIATSLNAEYATKSRGLLRWLGSIFGKVIRTGGSNT